MDARAVGLQHAQHANEVILGRELVEMSQESEEKLTELVQAEIVE
jgi:hypothetical protein